MAQPDAFDMPRFTLRIPTPDESEHAKAFTVHKNYLSALASYIYDSYGNPPNHLARLVEFQRALQGYVKMQARKPSAAEDIERFLTISFASELQLHLTPRANPSIVRYTNAWAPVHAYYAVYMALQAWFSMNGMSRLGDDHTGSLRTIGNAIAQRRLMPPPWSVSCVGCPPLEPVSYLGVPGDYDLNAHVEVLARPTGETFWARYGTLLSTTRRRRLERNFREWKRARGRKAMRAPEKLALARSLAPTTIFDFFWRLRVRANYRDVSSFLTWNVSDLEHQEYSESLITVTDATVTLIDSLVCRVGARALFRKLAEGFLYEHRASTGNALDFLERRASLLT